MAKKPTIASVLSFEKKLVCSDGYMYGTQWDARQQNSTALTLQEKSVRGTISNRLKPAVQNDPAKVNAEVEKANLQTVDTCALAMDQDTLKLTFTVKVLGGLDKPSACNNAVFKQTYAAAARQYAQDYGFTELAHRYAYNLASGRYLWRNRVGAEKIEVSIKVLNEDQQQEWIFDSKTLPLRNFDTHTTKLDELSTKIAKIFSSEDDFLILEINCYAKVGLAQEVYPSEELVLDKGAGKKSKILYSYGDERKAAMHSQKIGNALRTIDTWYPAFDDLEQSAGPIAIEPYGAVTNLGKAFRTPKEKQDFYSFFDKWACGESLDRTEDYHYVMAVLVRGGVFGQSDK